MFSRYNHIIEKSCHLLNITQKQTSAYRYFYVLSCAANDSPYINTRHSKLKSEVCNITNKFDGIHGLSSLSYCKMIPIIQGDSTTTINRNSKLNEMLIREHSNQVKSPDNDPAKTVKATVVNDSKSGDQPQTPTKIQMLKKAVAEYGTTVIIFHVSLSLVSLGVCYLLISSGFDAGQVYDVLGLQESRVVQNAGTFVAAYAVHKVMAPLRISVTLGATPLIVRYLRSKGILKK